MVALKRLVGLKKSDWAVDHIIISSDPNQKAIQGYRSKVSHARFPVSGRLFFMVFLALPFTFWTLSEISGGLRHSVATRATAHSTVISHVPSKSELAKIHHDIPDFVSIPNSDI